MPSYPFVALVLLVVVIMVVPPLVGALLDMRRSPGSRPRRRR